MAVADVVVVRDKGRRSAVIITTLLFGAVGIVAVVAMGGGGTRQGGEEMVLEERGGQAPFLTRLAWKERAGERSTSASLQRLAMLHARTGGKVGGSDEYPAVSFFAKMRETQSDGATSGPGFPQRGVGQQLDEQKAPANLGPASIGQAKMARAFSKFAPPKEMGYSQLREAYLKSRSGNGQPTAAAAAAAAAVPAKPYRSHEGRDDAEPRREEGERRSETEMRGDEERRRGDHERRGEGEEEEGRGKEEEEERRGGGGEEARSSDENRRDSHGDMDERRKYGSRGGGGREEEEEEERRRMDSRSGKEREEDNRDERDEEERRRDDERKEEARHGGRREEARRLNGRREVLTEGHDEGGDEKMPDDDDKGSDDDDKGSDDDDKGFKEDEDDEDGERDEYGDRKPLSYLRDAMPVAPKETKEERIRAIEEEERKIKEAQDKLKAEWKNLMASPHPVDASTRPDVIDTEYPTSTSHFRRKKKEMLTFRAAIRAFESDPEFNPVIVIQAHHLVRYGIPAPETDNIRVWRSWYREAYDKYAMVKAEVEAIAQGKWHRDDTWRKHHIHRTDAYKGVHREDVLRPAAPMYGPAAANGTAGGGKSISEAAGPVEGGGVDTAALERRVADMERGLHVVEGLLKARGGGGGAAASGDVPRLGAEPDVVAGEVVGSGPEASPPQAEASPPKAEASPPKAEASPSQAEAEPAGAAPAVVEDGFPHDTGEDTGAKEAVGEASRLSNTGGKKGPGGLVCAKGECKEVRREAADAARWSREGGGARPVEGREGGLMQTGPVPGAPEPLKRGVQALSKEGGRTALGEKQLGGGEEAAGLKAPKAPPLQAKFVGGKVMYLPKYDHSKTGDHGNKWLW